MVGEKSGTVAEMPKYKCHKEVWAMGTGELFQSDLVKDLYPGERGRN